MVKSMRVWTRQHKNVAYEIIEKGLYRAKALYVDMDLEEHSHLVRFAYDWLSENAPNRYFRNKGAEYPIWLSFNKDSTMMIEKDKVIIEMDIPKLQIAYINVFKWGRILNYGYIPTSDADEIRHKELLELYGVSDTKAVMSNFYPEIKCEVLQSWKRLFDESITLGSDFSYGIVWEIRKDWIKSITSKEGFDLI